MIRPFSIIAGQRFPSVGMPCGWQYNCHHNVHCAVRLLLAGALGLMCLAPFGCAKNESVKVVQGAVTCGGEKVPEGQVFFMPLEGTPAPNSSTAILAAQYRIEPRGGAPVG